MKHEQEEDEMICGLTVDERDVLLRGLNDLPDTMPPRIVWDRIREQAEAEGRGVVVVNGRLVEALHVEEAKRCLALAESIEFLES